MLKNHKKKLNINGFKKSKGKASIRLKNKI